MENIKKFKWLLVLALAMAMCVFIFFCSFYYRDQKKIADFLKSYKKFAEALSDFSKPVIAVNLASASALDQFNKIYSQITASMHDTCPNGDRLALAKEAISLNNVLLDCLHKTDDLGRKAGDALTGLNIKAAARISSITKNDAKLMSTMLEIADFSGKELDNLNAYKRAIGAKRDTFNKLLQKIVADSGGLIGFIEFLNHKDNQAIIQGQNADLDRLVKEFADLNNHRTAAYAHFHGLTGIKE